MERRKVEVFSADCPACRDAVEMVERLSCPSCDVVVHDMHDAQVVARARELGVRSVPAIAIDGKLAGCCADRGPDEATLHAAGLGEPM